MAALPSGDESDDSVNVLSERFDPLLALYSRNVEVPFPDVRVFNNLAEYESKVLKGQSSSTSAPKPDVSAEAAKNVSRRFVQKPTESEPRLQMPDETMHPARRKLLTNVLTRMDQSFVTGPLSILRRCVQEKLKAFVWTRSAQNLRGVLKGFIVAFDKHFNIAMIDVDEVYKIPKVCKKKRKQRMKQRRTDSDNSDQENEPTDFSPLQREQVSLPGCSTGKTEHPLKNVSNPRTRISGKSVSRPGHSTSKYHDPTLLTETNWLGVKKEDVRWRHVNQLFVRGDNVVCVNIICAGT